MASLKPPCLSTGEQFIREFFIILHRSTALLLDVIPVARKEPARGCGIKLLKDERGVIAIIYALSLMPLILVIALAVDFGFYVMAQSQLNLAADAAAIHAVRAAQQTYLDYSSTTAQAINAGQTAGQQWFLAQVGNIGIASVTPAVNVTYSPSPGGFSASVSYSGTVATNVARFCCPHGLSGTW